jgi:catechol 2,3-dioxygenase-like lactoylglutathione lyase family enzyme
MLNGINHITFAVYDVERSFDFYTKVLGFKPVAKWKDGAYFTAGNNWIAINQDLSVKESHRPDYTHIAFSCDSNEFHELRNRIINSGSIKWQDNRSEGNSLYFCDPDGHKLEIHVGNLNSRLEDMRKNPWDKITFF